MPPKGGKGKKKGGNKAPQATEPKPDDDWEAALNEFKDESQPASEPEPPKPEPAAEPTPPPAPSAPVDAAAAFLAQMGLKEDAGGAEESSKKDKKKKKGKKPAPKKAEVEEEAPKPATKQSAKGRMIAERLAKQREEEERLRKLQEEEEARLREEERKAEEEARKIEEEKERKKEKARQKLEEKKKAGTYKTKAQKQKERAAQERLEAMKQAGMLDNVPGLQEDTKKKRPVYGKKKKGKGQQDKGDDEVHSPATSEKPDEPKAAEEPDTPAEEAPESWEDQDDGKAAEEEEAVDSWEEVADSWEDAAVPDLGIKLPDADESAAAESPFEDLTLKQAEEEERKLRERALELKKRDDEKRRQQEEADKAKEAELNAMSKSEREAEKRKQDSRRRRMEVFEANEKLRSLERLRSPIVCIMGHVDTGKTKLLDKIRRTNVQDGEAGGITQQIGATFFPGTTLNDKTRHLNELVKMDLKLPGMLVIDTPGHEAFSNLRSRGSSLCDVAILVVDLMHGLEPQTIESIEMLRKKKCPFVVALNKVDRCYGWDTHADSDIRTALKSQSRATMDEIDTRTKQIRTQLMERGLNAELYWQNNDIRGTVSMVPTSAITGEGIPDLLHMLVRISQTHMAQKLSYSPNLQCTVLEVKVIEGLGCTVDVILVNGELHNSDKIVVCTTDGAVVTPIRALLTPPPNRELRIKSQYVHHEHIQGAMGIKICAHGLENAIAGSGIMVVGSEDDPEDLKEEVMQEFSSLATSLATDSEGVFAQASTLGALEALLVFLREECKPPIPVSEVAIGPIFKKEVLRAALMHEKNKPEFATILAFDVPIDPDARAMAEEMNVKIFTADIIYHLFDQFTRHQQRVMEEEKERARATAVFPCVLQILKNMVFNQKEPIICGVEVKEGILKVGTPLCIPKNGFLRIGRVTKIESNHKEVQSVRKGTQCSVQIVNESNPNITFGRQFDHVHPLVSEISRPSIDALKRFFKDEMEDNDWRLVIKLKKVFSII